MLFSALWLSQTWAIDFRHTSGIALAPRRTLSSFIHAPSALLTTAMEKEDPAKRRRYRGGRNRPRDRPVSAPLYAAAMPPAFAPPPPPHRRQQQQPPLAPLFLNDNRKRQFNKGQPEAPAELGMQAGFFDAAAKPAHQSSSRFADLHVSPLTKRAMAEVFGYEFCTHVQELSLPACLAGGDVLAKAKTGTGKTIGFLIPVIERILHNRPGNGRLGALILSPTRELATQIYNEALKLLTFHSNIHADIVIGGTNMNSEVRRMQNMPPQILVATPGRCLDHLTNNNSPLKGMMRELRVLVCDEADNLLDMGFKPTIVKILQNLPSKEQRQALLFSATFPADVKELAQFALKTPWTEVDTVGEDTQTNEQVDQFHAVVPFEEQFVQLFGALRRHMQQDPNEYKVIVFFPTARQTQVFAEAFNLAGMPVFEMHSRKSQSQRTKTSDQFRAAQRGIMFSSDVSARGVDYPSVTLVVQVGVPSNKAQYVHRVGRTARAGKKGQALLMLCDFEAAFLNKLTDLPIVPMPPLPPALQQQSAQAVAAALQVVPSDTKEKAYVAWLGFYKSCPSCKFNNVSQLIDLGNRFAYLMGCLDLPQIDAQSIGKMGLKGVPGLNVLSSRKGGGGRGRGSGGSGSGRGRGRG